MFVYNALPIETHMAMISAEMANIPILESAAQMWTEVRAWIEAAQTELSSRTNTLTPQWTDQAGRAMEQNLQQTLAELSAWGERIDASQVTPLLTTLAATIPEANATVSSLFASYEAAISNPWTAPSAPAFQQASGARMTALGVQFDAAMLAVCAAAGVASPTDLVPGVNKVTSISPADIAKGVDTATSALSSVQSLQSMLTSGAQSGTPGTQSGLSNLTNGATGSVPSLPGLISAGPSLAGLTSALTPPVLPGGGLGIGGLSSGNVPPTPSVPPMPLGVLGGAGGLPMAMAPSAASSVSGASGIQPGATTGIGGAVPMVPPHPVSGSAAGTLRPGTAELASGAGRGRQAATESDGVLAALRGRSGNGDPTGFTLAPSPRGGVSGSGSIQLLDEELWQADSIPPTTSG